MHGKECLPLLPVLFDNKLLLLTISITKKKKRNNCPHVIQPQSFKLPSDRELCNVLIIIQYSTCKHPGSFIELSRLSTTNFLWESQYSITSIFPLPFDASNMSKQSSCLGKLFTCVILPAIIIGGGGGLVYYFLSDDENFQNAAKDTGNAAKDKGQDLLDKFKNLTLFKAEDPFVDINGTAAWDNEGEGLKLTVVNNLNSQWHDIFYQSVAQWDDGSPDSMTLVIEEGQPDTECAPVDGILKVCDGDYGETDWKGINTVLIDDRNVILASAARMNEFFLPETSDVSEREYTMCHEIGHGFGLDHTDENFYNLNRGDCMDYTTFPESNKHPGEFNFEILHGLYGSVGGSNASGNSTTNNNRKLRNSGTKRSMKKDLKKNTNIDSWIMESYNEINSYFVGTQHVSKPKQQQQQQGYRLLKRTSLGESHEYQIGNGHRILVHVLLRSNV